MTALLAIAIREYASNFRTSLGWIVIALYLLLSGFWVAFATINPGEPASLRVFFSISQWLLLIVAPAISMRLVSEELRTGTIEPLMAAPISEWQAIPAKYLGALAFFITMLAPTLLYVGVLELVADPDYGPLLAGYAGLILVGMLYLAVGLVISTFTQSQVVALLATFFFFIALHILGTQIADRASPRIGAALRYASLAPRIGDFAKGVVELRHVVFFVAWSCFAIAVGVISLESRRWR
ncbi:MAG: ABC transporter permease subunit [Phycisphaeraceae bacterium]|nr:ABC transporter permease subunit [Phycisphaerales bacterium]MCB9842887.1 ABC transporter permease subunit [Phycisphaeraceae bacterium]